MFIRGLAHFPCCAVWIVASLTQKNFEAVCFQLSVRIEHAHVRRVTACRRTIVTSAETDVLSAADDDYSTKLIAMRRNKLLEDSG
jgi:hypothetical protein